MNTENLQKQIDERCPCFSKPLIECDCNSEETPGMSNNTEKLDKIIELLTEIQNQPESWNKAIKAKIIGNVQEALRLAVLMKI